MRLDPARFNVTEHYNQNWTATVEANTKLEDVLDDTFFANVTPRLRQYDHIRVSVDTGEWYAELLVIACGKNWAKCISIFHIDLTECECEEKIGESYDRFFVQYRGAHLKWCVIRKDDKEPIKEQCMTKQDAQSWLSSYVMTL